MVGLVLLRLALLVGVVGAAAVVDPTVGGLPVLVATGLVLLLVANLVDHRELLRALSATTSSLVSGLSRVMVADSSAPVLHEVTGLSRYELAQRGACWRLQCPDVPGKPRARAPGVV